VCLLVEPFLRVLGGVPSENGQWSTLRTAVNAQTSPCGKSIALAMAQCAEGGSAVASAAGDDYGDTSRNGIFASA
jgi:hypothetical protein